MTEDQTSDSETLGAAHAGAEAGEQDRADTRVAVKTPLGTLASHTGEPEFEAWLHSQVQLPEDAHSGRQVMAHPRRRPRSSSWLELLT